MVCSASYEEHNLNRGSGGRRSKDFLRITKGLMVIMNYEGCSNKKSILPGRQYSDGNIKTFG